jgi:uncharacterized LabA/DUF88 family protein
VDRCALFVDAGYLLADGAMAVHGTHRRESVTWDYPGLLQLLANLAMERSRMPLLRCYWYDSTVEGRRTPDHDALADLPGVKLRLAKMRPGRREGVEGEIHRDLTTLARNKAVSDAMVVSGEEDLAEVIADVQDMGMRVTLLHISSDGNAEIPRALRQECDDIVEINVAQLRPYAELISGAEPPRRGEREGGMLALRAGSGSASTLAGSALAGSALAGSNGNGNGRALLAGRVTGGQQAAPSYPPAAAAQYQQPAAQQRLRRDELPGDREEAQQAEAPAVPEFTPAEFGQTDRADGGTEFAPEFAPFDEHGTVVDFGAAFPDYRPPLGDYGASADYGPSIPDFTPAPAAAQAGSGSAHSGPPSPAGPDFSGGPDFASRPGAGRPEFAAPGRQERADLPEYPSQPAREELYGAPVAEDLSAERSPARLRPEADSLRPVESGYSPGGVRDQFQLETPAREPVPVGAAQVRRLPTRGGGQPGHAANQPSPGLSSPGPSSPGSSSLGPSSVGPTSPGQQSLGQPGPSVQGPAVPVGMDSGSGQPGSGGQPIAPVVPMDQAGLGYGGNRGGGYGGPRSANGPGSAASGIPPMSLVGPPSGPLGPSVHADPAGPGNGNGGQNGLSGQNGQNGQGGQQEPGAHPLLSPVVAPPSGYQDGGGPAGYSGGQSGVSLADAVQSAHEEGQAFGESVARDAPALWLEAVLARKPRMPSDLEARLLQGSALPIDFLLHDEVRHALRRGFWDALERARR